MTLADYLEKTKTDRSDFAAEIEVSEAYLSRLVNRKRNPSFEISMRIFNTTKGAVTFPEMTAINAEDAASEATSTEVA